MEPRTEEAADPGPDCEPEGIPGAKAQESRPGGEHFPATAASGQVVIPSSAELSILLEGIDRIDDMQNLHEAAAAWESATMRMRRAFEDVAAIAEFRIRLERKIGLHLAKTVRRGRPKKWSGDQTNSAPNQAARLPRNISKSRACDYRRLAAVPDDSLDAYLAKARECMRLPSAKGLIRFWSLLAPNSRASQPVRAQTDDPACRCTVDSVPEAPAVPAVVLDAVRRFMRVDVVVGGDATAFPKAHAVAAELLQRRHLRGDVFVAECPDPGGWLPQLEAARIGGAVAQVVVVLPAETGAAWFKLVEKCRWVCCFLRGSGLAVIYHGERSHGFWAAFHHSGTVMHAGDHD